MTDIPQNKSSDIFLTSSSTVEQVNIPPNESKLQAVVELELEPREEPMRQHLSTAMLVFLTFFAVSGGPYGLEDAVSVGGPLLTFLALFVVPWIWSLPAALITAELSTAMPYNGGYVLWIQRAFGPFWGFQQGLYKTVNTIFDLALYPVLLTDYLAQIVREWDWWEAFLIQIFIIGGCVVMNIRGVRIVGKASIVFTVILLSPFVALMILGIAGLRPGNWLLLSSTDSGVWSSRWGLFVSVIAWNTCGFDNVSSVAGEMKNPKKSYLKAMLISLGITMFFYIGPLAVGVSYDTQFDKWTDGYWSEIAAKVGGYPLKVWTVIGGCVSSLGMLNTYLLTTSQALVAWAEPEMLGAAWMRRQSKWGTPWVAIIITAAAVTFCTLLSFQVLIQVDQIMFSVALIMQYLAFLYLRFREPNMPRPYRIPGNNRRIVAFCIFPLLFCAVTAIIPIINSIFNLVVAVVVIFFGFIGFWLLRYCRNKMSFVTLSDSETNNQQSNPSNNDANLNKGLENQSNEVPTKDQETKSNPQITPQTDESAQGTMLNNLNMLHGFQPKKEKTLTIEQKQPLTEEPKGKPQ